MRFIKLDLMDVLLREAKEILYTDENSFDKVKSSMLGPQLLHGIGECGPRLSLEEL